MNKYYWHHFGVAITHPTDLVHTGSIYYLSYNFWSLAQTSQFIEGVAVSPDITSQQPLEDSPAASAAENSGGAPSPMMDDEAVEPEAKRLDSRASPIRDESPELPEIDIDEPGKGRGRSKGAGKPASTSKAPPST